MSTTQQIAQDACRRLNLYGKGRVNQPTARFDSVPAEGGEGFVRILRPAATDRLPDVDRCMVGMGR